MDVQLAPGSPTEPAVAALLRAGDAYTASLYPPASIHSLSPDELLAPGVHFLVAKTGPDVLGCGAVVLIGDGSAELKRMYVAPTARRLGIGRRLLAALERLALDAGVRVVRLETGVSQPEALALYRRSGYVDRGPFGAYPDDPLSVFLEKQLPVRPRRAMHAGPDG